VAIKEYIPASLARRDAGYSVRIRSEQHEESFGAGLAGFMNEARLLAQFKHPALVEVLQFWEENGTAYMVMPRYHGRTLRQVLRERGARCDEAWLKRTLAPVLDVLELLHERSVFHRDIAPDNILIQRDDRAVLLDLGSAREILGDREQSVTVVVKPGYAPLEQYSGEFSLPQGPWTDVYAFGAVLHFAVTGAPPQASISRVMKDSRPLLAASPRPGFSHGFSESHRCRSRPAAGEPAAERRRVARPARHRRHPNCGQPSRKRRTNAGCPARRRSDHRDCQRRGNG
jgi:non-specific serine/threonine protein kinase